VLFFTCLFLISCKGNETKENRNESTETQDDYAFLVDQYCIKHHVNGCVLVAKNDRIVFQKAYGFADFEWNIQNTLETKFKIGSVSKQFTAFVILRLVQEGLLDLHTPIKKYIPTYRGERADVITLHHLLSHTSGLTSDNSPDQEFKLEKLPHLTSELVRYVEKEKLISEPGKQFNYSNFGYSLLAYIAETVTTKSYGKLIEEYISLPFNLQDTKHHDNKNIETRLVRGYKYDLVNGVENVKYLDDSYVTGSGSIVSTVLDLYKWSMQLDTTTVLSNSLKDLLFKANMENYAYGWEVVRWPISTNVTLDIQKHEGSVNGFVSEFSRVGNDKIVYILLENVWNAKYPTNVSHSTEYTFFRKPSLHDIIIPSLYGIKKEVPKQSALFEASKKLKKDSIEAFTKTFDLYAKDTANFYLDAAELNGLGLELLYRNRINEAEQIMEYAVGKFPDFISYGNLAEVYETNHKPMEALKYYNLALNDYNNNLNKNNAFEGRLAQIKRKAGNLSARKN
jgi:CubicO group peptidase (beta-lactamase class C family)